ncbi:MAG: hypothetical protein U5K32_04030 [Bacteroidales bacterium]|nr:hypothetical protein [Bacteroidales bacterium]
MDRNLGASQVATASDDENGYGDLYQWGRSADGHESRTSDIYDGDANGKPSTYNENGRLGWEIYNNRVYQVFMIGWIHKTTIYGRA